MPSRALEALLRPWKSPVAATLGVVARLDPLGTAGLVIHIVVSAGVPLAFTVVTGLVVGAVPDAVREGLGSPAGRALVARLGVLSVLYLAHQVLPPFGNVLVSALGRKLHRHLHETVLHATLTPAGVGHLEDPRLRDEISKALGVAFGSGPGQLLLLHVPPVAVGRLHGIGSAVLLAGFRWWAPVLLGAIWLLLNRSIAAEIDQAQAAVRSATPALRRSDYFRSLAAEPGMAKELRLFGLGGWILERFGQHWREGKEESWGLRRASARRTAAGLLLIGPAYALVFGLVALGAAQGEVSLAAAAVFAQAALGLKGLGYLGDQQWGLRARAEAVPAALQLQERIEALHRPLTGERRADGLPQHEIRFEDVRFVYPGSDQSVFDGLDLTIPAGRSLGIVGANGAGKTTLVKLLARLYDPDDGRITIDGTELRLLDPPSWRAQLSVVFHDFIAYPLSAADNVGFGCLELADKEPARNRASRRAGALEMIERLPDGWQTVLSREFQNGVDLSAGEWQRVALARALLAVECGAKLLILDEPSARLDVRAEAELFDRLLEHTSGLTTILISHRFSTVRKVERICVVEAGRVAEQGSHEELIDLGGRYAKMFRLQAARFSGGEARHA